ncbi:MAG TPA: class I SAM-dependent methyltransferase [Steroidobacteraceae bacterium]|nr:class I SAM-dependent methyltransferase [Steroidobacteraceae bacterium]
MNTTTTLLQPVIARPSAGVLGWAERGILPDLLIRRGIRNLCARRLGHELRGTLEERAERFRSRIESLGSSPIAIHADAANAQHYELPPAFFQHCLGRRLKYSCGYYRRGDETLDQAEEAMLELYAERAELEDGQSILELGCGWGSLTLWMAERYPRASIRAVCNSHSQRQFIEQQCLRRRIGNVQVTVEDVSRLLIEPARYDRCVSVEMFEHVRNYQRLLENIAAGLAPGGKLFVHIFAHRSAMYPFETDAEDDWMGRFFFTGGLMPSIDTLLWFQRHVRIERRWLVDGTHYRRTADHWLAHQDARRHLMLPVLESAYGAPNARLWFQRWRMFFMACAELFGYHGGREWMVAHYRFVRQSCPGC